MTTNAFGVALLLGAAAPLAAQTAPPADPMPGMAAMPGMHHDMASMPGMAMDEPMMGMLGPHPMMRESSGSSWQPDSSPMMGVHFSAGDWSLMADGNVTGSYSNQGGPRGDDKAFSTSMGMLMGSRAVGDHGTFALRGMVSLDPLIGKRGYPLLFATGETADGRTALVDRQHPHDLLMELAASYAYDLGGGYALSVYAGLPGEPALGPPAFMHRISGVDIPEAPITHHWLDSTHITFGVITAGLEGGKWKLEASAFRGREPDQYRYDFDTPSLDSWSVRAFYNPTANLSLQASTGHLHSPEQLRPDEDEQRTTVSATWNLPFGQGGNWATTLAGSAKHPLPGPTLYGWLGESALRFDARNTVFGRLEHVDEAELFPDDDPRRGIFPVTKFSLGYFRTLPLGRHLAFDVGGLGSAYAYSGTLDAAYGKGGAKSFLLFVRIKLAS